MVQRRQGTWVNPATGRSLFYRLWEPPAPQALVVLVHGFGEHGGRYEAVGHALAAQGVAAACPDLWGHGRSAGQRGDVEQFRDYVDDLEAFTNQPDLKRLAPRGLSVFGHSFGGLAAVHWALHRPPFLRSLIVQSPLLGVGFRVPAWKERLAGLFDRWWPRLAFPISLDPRWLSHDPAVAQGYRQDPLVHDRITVRAYAALQEAMRQAREQAAQVASPTLMLLGNADRVIDLGACRAFFERLVVAKRLMTFPEAYHELHHEAVNPLVVEAVAAWARAHG